MALRTSLMCLLVGRVDIYQPLSTSVVAVAVVVVAAVQTALAVA